MIRMTRQTDYGIVLLTHVAAGAPGAVHAARDLAEATSLSVPMVSKILKVLAREGVLASHRGAHGGYSLARDASDVSIADVIRALEGPIGITECTGDLPGDCEHEQRCPCHDAWRRINEAVVQALDGITLAEMANGGRPGLVHIDVGARS